MQMYVYIYIYIYTLIQFNSKIMILPNQHSMKMLHNYLYTNKHEDDYRIIIKCTQQSMHQPFIHSMYPTI